MLKAAAQGARYLQQTAAGRVVRVGNPEWGLESDILLFPSAPATNYRPLGRRAGNIKNTFESWHSRSGREVLSGRRRTKYESKLCITRCVKSEKSWA